MTRQTDEDTMAANLTILNDPADTAQVYAYIELAEEEQAFIELAVTTPLPALGEFGRRNLLGVLDKAFFELHMRMMLDDTLKVFADNPQFEVHRQELGINKAELTRIVGATLCDLHVLFARYGQR